MRGLGPLHVDRDNMIKNFPGTVGRLGSAYPQIEGDWPSQDPLPIFWAEQLSRLHKAQALVSNFIWVPFTLMFSESPI